eukprot:CAMPEP_0180145828 /NCGR_PEP_ID=MMETSP0986-20121125/17995_1 /TAXON_ID=697907 /ORGANISM="non described non described, Strain CCMP2293" /LENGTH=347 /DNA_ID=CAMNT_0022090465 /DNA_START=270 /DNA_END=1313 /DNA_ORIENTATION=-
MSSVAISAAVTFGVLGYASLYLEQMRMMIFLSLQSLWVPTFKHKFCRVSVEASAEQLAEAWPRGLGLAPPAGAELVQKMEFSAQRVLPSLGSLMALLYLWDGMSGLTSGTLFLIVLPEVTARLPAFPSWKTILFYLTLVLVSAPIAAVVIGATNFEKEMMELPEVYKNTAKTLLGARPESVPDYYAVIGVRRGAEGPEIKKMFRELSKIYHPDKTVGNLELQEKFVKISDAVRKLTGKQSDKAAHTKELENAELQDMVTRAVYYVMLSGLWFTIAAMQWFSKRKEGQPTAEGGEGGAEQVAAPPPKPRKPLTKGQWLYLAFSVPIVWGYFWLESTWRGQGGDSDDLF